MGIIVGEFTTYMDINFTEKNSGNITIVNCL